MSSNTCFFNSEKFISTEEVLLEAKNIVSHDFNKLFQDKQFQKIFREEIFPIIKFCEKAKAKEVLFCGHKNNSIDAMIKDKDGKLINVECTTSINARYKELLYEYNKQHSSCFIGPHSKAIDISNIEKANSNDIVYFGSKHNRVFVEQESLNRENSFISCIVDLNKYIKEDIEKIKHKVDKGISENLYQNYILILACEHDIDIQQVEEYRNLLLNYWQNISNNPFSGLFVVNYDSLLFRQTNKDTNIDPMYAANIPVPIIFIKNQ